MSLDILQFIPQRAPIIMVHRVISAEEAQFVTQFDITEDNIFLIDGILQEPALIENIAQSAAAGLGTLAKRNGERKAGLGFIGSVTKLVCNDLPAVGNTIETTIEVITQFGSIILIKGSNSLNGKLLLECEMKIVTGQ